VHADKWQARDPVHFFILVFDNVCWEVFDIVFGDQVSSVLCGQFGHCLWSLLKNQDGNVVGCDV
jgi:hypothetical protein